MSQFKVNRARIFTVSMLLVALSYTAVRAQQPSWDPKRPDPAYTLTRVAGGAVLVHNPTGNAWWLLIEKGSKKRKTRATWLPINKVEDYGDVAKWLLAQESNSTRSVVDVEIAFAKEQLMQARKDYGSRHPAVVELTQGLRSLEKVKRAFEKQKSTRRKSASPSEKHRPKEKVEEPA